MIRRGPLLYLSSIGLLLAGVIAVYAASFLNRKAESVEFDGARALGDVFTQVSFGPRIAGTPGHAQFLDWARSELETAGWQVEIQESRQLDRRVQNIVAKRNDQPPQIILGAHYDTRMLADQDPDPAKRAEPVPGANDGASGVAVLLELARTLPDRAPIIWLVFFDAEDNGGIQGLDWILGSRAFVQDNVISPQAVVIVDMVGDADLNLYMEKNSDSQLQAEIWRTALALGYGESFIAQKKYSMLDDHTPFLAAGMRAIDIIDFDYPYWHTIEDTPDKISADSLEAVGATLWAWIVAQNNQPQ
ncbi:MAG TPA: M28 family peptidase [Anaerolineales bacterium]|jgi:Zn-dependent M28 family amino/carboxypeptidase